MAGHSLITADHLFWGILSLQAVLIMWCLHNREILGGIVVLLAGLVALEYQGSLQILQFAQQRPGDAVAFVVVYLLIGVLWGMFQWWLVVKNACHAYESAKAHWLHPRSLMGQAATYRNMAERATSEEMRERYLSWSRACEQAAHAGGGILTLELQPIWKDYIHDRRQIDSLR